MESFLQAFLAIVTPYINRRVDTGDRNYDIAIAGFLTMCISSVLFWIVKKMGDDDFKNWVLYKFWYRQKSIDDFQTEWYSFPKTEDGYNYTLLDLEYIVKGEIQKSLAAYIQKCRTPTIKGGTDSWYPLLYNGESIVYYKYQEGASADYILVKKGDYKASIMWNKWKKTFENSLNDSNTPTTHRQIKGLNKKNELTTLGKIGSHKTFDTIFYDQKVEVLDAITKFKEGRLYPKGISMDNKLGILLYGPPGTGKTGTISACANLLGRDVMVLDFSVIKTCEELDNVLKPEEFDKYIYVFDEFDCILDVLVSDEKKAVEEADKEDTTDWSKLLMVAEGEERKQILEMLKEGRTKQKDKSQSLNLGYLLRKLDGLEDATGRFIIATTNNPDHIHPALLRPGRFDIKLCLGNCSAKMYVDILGAFFELDEEGRAKVATAGLPVGRWSPLQTINMALTKKTLGATLEALQKPT